jgi:hypothetical protein
MVYGVSEGVHDDLYIKTMVFEHGGEKVAFITLDAHQSAAFAGNEKQAINFSANRE